MVYSLEKRSGEYAMRFANEKAAPLVQEASNTILWRQ